MKKLSFYSKIFLAFIGLSVIPLTIHVLYFSAGLKNSDSFLRSKAEEALDGQTEFMLMQTADAAAERVALFLYRTKSDIDTLSLAEPSAETYQRFYSMRLEPVWEKVNGVETRLSAPLYSEISFADLSGREKIRIRDGASAPLRDISNRQNTEFLSENYFDRCISTPPDEIYVTRLTGRHVTGGAYKGFFRFCKKTDDGLIILSLNQRHLDEQIRHTEPSGAKSAEIPYETGNYGFIFDDEGWMVAHPVPGDIRGVDEKGRLLPPLTEKSGKHGSNPFNLFFAGHIDKNYPAAAASVRMGRSGVTSVTNAAGITKMMAYAPVRFPYGEFRQYGIFGGVAIGAEAGQFHKAAEITSDTIRFEFKSYIARSWMFVSAVLLISIYVSIRLARSVVKPLSILSEATRQMSEGRLSVRAEVSSDDELGRLAVSFNSMAENLEQQHAFLENSLEELERSRQDILWEQVFKTTVFENLDTGIMTVSRDGSVTFMNAQARDIFGILVFDEDITLDSITGRFPAVRAILDRGRDRIAGEYISAEADGAEKTFRVSVIPLAIGSYDGIIITIEDVSERISLRNRVERMERLASLGRLSAGLAHEIRNPLTGISLLLDDLHDGLIGHPEEQRLIQRALSEIERLEKLVNELLSFARVPEMNMQKDSVIPVVEESVSLLKRQHKNVIFVTEYAEGLPDFPMDRDKLKQALLNLIKNGAEAMKDGGTLTVSVTFDSTSVRISVKDTGEGISADRIPLIFEPFFTKKHGGTGLGLSITHNIITDHHGKISVSSTVGQGTEFTITLPLQHGGNPPLNY